MKLFLARPSFIFWPVLLISYLFAWINGFRMPNLWSVNYYIPSVMDGFYRRSLIGNAAYLLGDFRFDYHTIASIQIFVFIALNLLIIRACLKTDNSIKWLWALFLLSPAGGYFFHEIGYIEQLLYLLLFIAIGIRSHLIGFVIMISCLWIHEMALFTVLPLYISYKVLKTNSIKHALIMSGASLICFGILYLFFQTVSANHLKEFLDMASLKANYQIRDDYYTIFSNRFTGERFQWYFSLKELKTIAIVSPLWFCAGYLFSKFSSNSLNRVTLFVIGFFSSLMPLILGTFGWDTYRWIFLSTSSAMCCLFFSAAKLSSKFSWFIAAFLVIFVIFGYLEYFDGYFPRLSQSDAFRRFLLEEFPKIIFEIPKR